MALIFTTKGNLQESLLTKTDGGHENDTEVVTWQEWTLNGEIVKREVQMHLKQGLLTVPTASF